MYAYLLRYCGCFMLLCSITQTFAADPLEEAPEQIAPSIELNSEIGDPIGEGNAISLIAPSNIKLSTQQIYFDHEDGYQFFFEAPLGQSLAAGAYFQASHALTKAEEAAGIYVNSAGKVCDTLTGHFYIHAMDIAQNILALDFEQICDDSEGKLTGTIRLNSLIPTPYLPPIAIITPPQHTYLEGQDYTFSAAHSFSHASDIVSYEWSSDTDDFTFENPETDTLTALIPLSFPYQNERLARIWLTVTDSLAMTHTTFYTFTVQADVTRMPTLNISYPHIGFENERFDLIASAFDNEGAITSVQWVSDDESIVFLDDTALTTSFIAPALTGNLTSRDIDLRCMVLNHDGSLSLEKIFTITIATNNQSPIAVKDTYTLEKGKSKRFAPLSNDHDQDGTLDTSTFTITVQPAYGEALISASGEIVYQHTAPHIFNDMLTYTITDNKGLVSNHATVNLIIYDTVFIPVDPAPITPDPIDTGAIDINNSIIFEPAPPVNAGQASPENLFTTDDISTIFENDSPVDDQLLDEVESNINNSNSGGGSLSNIFIALMGLILGYPYMIRRVVLKI